MTVVRVYMTCPQGHTEPVDTATVTIHLNGPAVIRAWTCPGCGAPSTRYETLYVPRNRLALNGARVVRWVDELNDPLRCWEDGEWEPGEADAALAWISRPGLKYVADYASVGGDQP